MAALRNPSAMLVNLAEETPEDYQQLLKEAKDNKAEIARNKVSQVLSHKVESIARNKVLLLLT